MGSRHTLTLEVNDLDITRGDRTVAGGITFTLTPGSALCIRGENGTGKTSLLRTIAGFAQPAHGDVVFSDTNGPVDPIAVRAQGVHWLGGEDGLADRLCASEMIAFWKDLYAVQADHTVLEKVGLAEKASAPAGRLSTGQRRRLGLARLLLAPKAMWLMDEPMSGLDTLGRTLVLDAIAAHRAQGGLVLMASHDEGIDNAATLRLKAAHHDTVEAQA